MRSTIVQALVAQHDAKSEDEKRAEAKVSAIALLLHKRFPSVNLDKVRKDAGDIHRLGYRGPGLAPPGGACPPAPGAGPRVIAQAPGRTRARRRERRPGTARRRSSARSGDSPSDSERPAVDWRWADQWGGWA